MNRQSALLLLVPISLLISVSRVAAQPVCASPLNFRVEDVFDTYVKLRWSNDPNSQNPPVSYRIIYGLKGFDLPAGQGDTATSTTTKITVNGLQKKMWYDAYIEQFCGAAAGYSDRIGPVSFQTYWTKDVGIIGVVSPVSGCELGSADSVKVLIKNFGSNPYSIIPLRYTLNDEEVYIPKPSDGVYSNVLGKDSTDIFTFEAINDFSTPGEYKIVAFTKFEGDEDLSNDTFTYYFTNRLLSPYHQPFETWNGGWQVKTGGGASSFEYGIPDKPGIPAAPTGQKAWVTGLSDPYLANELSYLESPCFDFSNLLVDPVIEFSIAHDIESNKDGAWLEASTNNGQSWTKVGGFDEGIHWYNETTAGGPVWSGFSDGWVTARHTLNGVAGKTEVRLRFVFKSDDTGNLGGLGIDNIRIFPAFNKDLAGSVVAVATQYQNCGQQAEPVTFTFANIGAQTQSNFQVAYSINGAAPVVETVTFSIARDQSRSYSFNATFDSRDKLSVIKCWTKLTGDFAPANDTATLIIDHRPHPAPFQENFEAQVLPQGWFSTGLVTNGHGNSSYVLAANLKVANPVCTHLTPRYGYIGANDSLVFSYRIVNFSGGGATLLSPGTRFEVQVSTDCGDNYQTIYTIDNSNHTPSTQMQQRKISLSALAGNAVIFKFKGAWSLGDFWFDLDNINLLSCPADMNITTTVTNTAPGQNNGSALAEPTLGNPPFFFHWSTGATTPDIHNLSAGAYTVTITDSFGCTDSAVISIGTSAATEIEGLTSLSVYPNPGSGLFRIYARFDREPGDIRMEVTDLLGQTVWQEIQKGATAMYQSVDLTGHPDGLYLLVLHHEGQVLTRKLVKKS